MSGTSSVVTAAVILVTLASVAAPAAAQSSPQTPTRATPWDVTAMVGIFSGRPDEPSDTGYRDNWFNTGQGSVILGRHLAPHVKAELEFSGTGEGRRYVERSHTVPGYPYPAPSASEVFSSVRQVVASVTWQFFENEWVHPFMQAGVSFDRERVRSHTWHQEIYTGTPSAATRVVLAEERTDGPETTTNAHATLASGVKMYVTPRAFVRTDARYAIGSHSQSLSLRIGFGFDF